MVWPDEARVVRGGAVLSLTAKEAALLRWLIDHADRTVPVAELMVKVWGYAPQTQTTTIHTTMRSLRRKIEVTPSDPRHLMTVRGEGYRFVPLAVDPHRSGQIPAAVDRFFGRTGQMAAIDAAFADGARLVTLIGPGGIGKTRLAREHAARSQTGAWIVWVDLQTADTADDARQALRAALGLAPQADLEGALGGRGLTRLILDNLEQLNDRMARQIARWLAEAPELTILATSRRPMAIRGERRLIIAPLDASDASALFADRLRSHDPGRAATDAQLARIAAATEGHPLALEIASMQAAHQPIGTLIAALDRPLEALRHGPRDLPERQSSLHATLEWSWAHLPAVARKTLLAVYPVRGPITGALAASLIPDGDHGLRVLAERGLVREGALPVPLRHFCQQQDPDPAHSQRRWWAQLADDAGQLAPPDLAAPDAPGRFPFARYLSDLQDACRDALRRTDPVLAARAGLGAGAAFMHRGPVSDAIALIDGLVAADLPPRERWILMVFKTEIQGWRDPDRSIARLHEMIADAPDPQWAAWARMRRAGMLQWNGEVEEAHALIAEALSIITDDLVRGRALMIRGVLFWRQDQLHDAIDDLRDAADALQHAPIALALTQLHLSMALFLVGDVEDALALSRAAAECLTALENTRTAAVAWTFLAIQAMAGGHPAVDVAGAAFETARRSGSLHEKVHARWAQAAAAVHASRCEEGRRWTRAAERLTAQSPRGLSAHGALLRWWCLIALSPDDADEARLIAMEKAERVKDALTRRILRSSE
ncbi:MAG: winged helix-turn-helix domain-containing protein [Myxococcota bacterium]